MIARGPSTISTPDAWKTGRQPVRSQEIEPPNQIVRDALERQRRVDAETRPQLIRLDHVVRVGVDASPELGHAIRLHRQAGGLLVAAELDEQVGAVLEGCEQVEVGDAPA